MWVVVNRLKQESLSLYDIVVCCFSTLVSLDNCIKRLYLENN